jgi:hypothetical protein
VPLELASRFFTRLDLKNNYFIRVKQGVNSSPFPRRRQQAAAVLIKFRRDKFS